MKSYIFTLYRNCYGKICADSAPVKKTISIREYLAEANPQKLAEVCAKGARKRRTYFYRVGQSAAFAEAIASAPTIAPEKIGIFSCTVDGRFKEWQVRSAIIEAVSMGRRDAAIELRSEAGKQAHLKKVYVFPFSVSEA